MSFNPIARVALEQISFSKWFENLCRKYNKSKGMEKTEKSLIIRCLKDLVYHFKYGEGSFYFIEYWNEDIKSHTVFNLKRGIFLGYFNIAINGEFIDLNSGNFGNVAFTLNKDLSAPGMPVFSSYDELKDIAKEVLKIYEDFKTEFLKHC
jgi:hypothetical protein